MVESKGGTYYDINGPESPNPYDSPSMKAKHKASGHGSGLYHDKISLLTFVALTMLGFVLPAVAILFEYEQSSSPLAIPAVAGAALMFPIWIISWLIVRAKTHVEAGVLSYLFVLTAPVGVSAIIGVLFSLLNLSKFLVFVQIVGLFGPFYAYHLLAERDGVEF